MPEKRRLTNEPQLVCASVVEPVSQRQLPPSVLLREKEQAQHKQASQKENRKQDTLFVVACERASQKTSFSNKEQRRRADISMLPAGADLSEPT